MIQTYYDPATITLAIWMGPGVSPDSDWEKVIQHLRRMDEEAVQRNTAWLIIGQVASGSERPNATWRKRFAEERLAWKAKKRCSALVTDSLLFRGLLTTLNWIVPQPKEEDFRTFPTLPEALQWAETARNVKLTTIREILARGITASGGS